MAKDLTAALDNVEITYQNLIEIANSISQEVLSESNILVESLGLDINSLSTDELKDYMWKLQMSAFRLSEIKEKAAFKAEISETLQKEKLAEQFNQVDGTVQFKNNTALINSSEETVVQALMEYLSNQFKTKVDQLHRLVNVIQSILMNRMQEAKLSSVI